MALSSIRRSDKASEKADIADIVAALGEFHRGCAAIVKKPFSCTPTTFSATVAASGLSVWSLQNSGHDLLSNPFEFGHNYFRYFAATSLPLLNKSTWAGHVGN